MAFYWEILTKKATGKKASDSKDVWLWNQKPLATMDLFPTNLKYHALCNQTVLTCPVSQKASGEHNVTDVITRLE